MPVNIFTNGVQYVTVFCFAPVPRAAKAQEYVITGSGSLTSYCGLNVSEVLLRNHNTLMSKL